MINYLETECSIDSSGSFFSEFLEGLAVSFKPIKIFGRPERRTNNKARYFGIALGIMAQLGTSILSSVHYVNEKYILPSRQTTSSIDDKMQ